MLMISRILMEGAKAAEVRGCVWGRGKRRGDQSKLQLAFLFFLMMVEFIERYRGEEVNKNRAAPKFSGGWEFGWIVLLISPIGDTCLGQAPSQSVSSSSGKSRDHLSIKPTRSLESGKGKPGKPSPTSQFQGFQTQPVAAAIT